MDQDQLHKALMTISKGLADLAEAVAKGGTVDPLPDPEQKESLKAHYSLAARDKRQGAVLERFVSGDVQDWTGPGGVRETALENGFTAKGLGGWFSGPSAMLKWAPTAKDGTERVQITPHGKKRLAIIKARASVAA